MTFGIRFGCQIDPPPDSSDEPSTFHYSGRMTLALPSPLNKVSEGLSGDILSAAWHRFLSNRHQGFRVLSDADVQAAPIGDPGIKLKNKQSAGSLERNLRGSKSWRIDHEMHLKLSLFMTDCSQRMLEQFLGVNRAHT